MKPFIQKLNINLFTQKKSPIVNFIICGTQKGGTTALYDYLKKHPNICMAIQKETHFFDNEKLFCCNLSEHFWYPLYHLYFIHAHSSHKAIGDATPAYMYWKNAPQRIWKYNPNMKLIAILRNPIDRAYSHWNMERSRNREKLSFLDAIQNEKKRLQMVLPYQQHRVYSYLDRGFYLEQIQRLWSYFPKEHVLIIKHEYFKNQAAEALRDICNFLEVDQYKTVTRKDIHSLPYVSKMTDVEKKYLHSIYDDDIRKLEHVLDWDCSDWLS